MKGPGGRRKFDLRRRWQCPVCGRRAYTSGRTVNRRCEGSTGQPHPPAWMKLLEGEPSPGSAENKP